MEQFYVIVITIAIVLLILALTYIGVFLIGDDTTQVTFPPHSNQCPDYWEVNGDGSCVIPGTNDVNFGNAGTADGFEEKTQSKDGNGVLMVDGNGNPILERDTAYTGIQPDLTNTNIPFENRTICEKKQWANRFEVVWDGVTNYNKC